MGWGLIDANRRVGDRSYGGYSADACDLICGRVLPRCLTFFLRSFELFRDPALFPNMLYGRSINGGAISYPQRHPLVAQAQKLAVARARRQNINRDVVIPESWDLFFRGDQITIGLPDSATPHYRRVYGFAGVALKKRAMGPTRPCSLRSCSNCRSSLVGIRALVKTTANFAVVMCGAELLRLVTCSAALKSSIRRG